jgi:hypothetical protein
MSLLILTHLQWSSERDKDPYHDLSDQDLRGVHVHRTNEEDVKRIHKAISTSNVLDQSPRGPPTSASTGTKGSHWRIWVLTG